MYVTEKFIIGHDVIVVADWGWPKHHIGHDQAIRKNHTVKSVVLGPNTKSNYMCIISTVVAAIHTLTT